MAKMQRTVRMTIAVTFRALDMDDPEDAPYYPSEHLPGMVEGWIGDALTDRDDDPQMVVVLSKLERRMVD